MVGPCPRPRVPRVGLALVLDQDTHQHRGGLRRGAVRQADQHVGLAPPPVVQQEIAVDDFTLVEVECLGACVNAPILQINDDFYEDLDGPATEALLDAFRAGSPPPPGSVIGRHGSAPIKGKTTLIETPGPATAGGGADDAR